MNHRLLVSWIALTAIIALGIWIASSQKMNRSSSGENVSTNNSIGSEIERLIHEINAQRGRTEFWDTWNIRLLFVAGLVASLLVMTAAGVSRSNRTLIRISDELGKAKDRKLQSDSKLKDEAIAEANRKAEEGNALAKTAQANIEAAKTEQEKLKKETAEARLETEKIKQVVTWRTISPADAIELEGVLSARPGSVNLRYTDGDPEALFLSIQVQRILVNAKWTVGSGAVKFPNAIAFGVLISGNADSEEVKSLKEGFAKIRMPLGDFQFPTSFAAFGVTTIPGAPDLMIGSRRPALP
jgi:hypothetical protein